jgi:hypothetical protein
MLSLNCKNVHHVEIYLPCNFEVNLITHLGVLALFSANLKKDKKYFSSYISKIIRDKG